MAFLKNHWFGFLLSLVVGGYFVVFLLVLFAPKQDIRQRGFVKCSAALSENMPQCGGGKWCLLTEVLRNGWCDVKVVGEGVALWAAGKQATPWANYFFEPLEAEPQMSAEALDYYQKNRENLKKSMERIKQLNQELEEKAVKHEEN